MRELIDCHIHSELCGHASGTVEQMISAAVFSGVTGIVVTEHLPLPTGMDPASRLSMPADHLNEYVQRVKNVGSRVRGLDVVVGGEADWLPDRAEEAAAIRAVARSAGVDVLLGSVHFLGDWAFDDPDDLTGWDERDVDQVWSEYFELWCDASRSGEFDVMAHPDLVKKFGHRGLRDPGDLYREAARAAADSGVLVEVSSAGLRKPVQELYPGPDLLRAFHDAGVEITVGSDAHGVSEVGWGIELAYEAASSAGYTKVAFPLGDGQRRWIEL